MDVTNSNGMKSCASAEASVFTQLTLHYKAYNQLVSFTSEANIPYMGVTIGHRTCRDALFFVCVYRKLTLRF